MADESHQLVSMATELGERDTPSPARPAPPATSCNCEELLSVDCQLETKELWDKFHDLGTEMIITKTGRYVTLIFLLFYFWYGNAITFHVM